jgi:hypothetical protein
MPRHREKACSLCQTADLVLFRVQQDASGAWIFVCHACWQGIRDNSFYVYGGTWKAHKRD